jgi:dTDP-6-deoxy-L-talose 4-dehydrogenase (NAD+)
MALQDKIGGIINCCSGKPISVRTFVENYFEEHNHPIKLNLGYYLYPDYEPFAFWGDVKKLTRAIGIVE